MTSKRTSLGRERRLTIMVRDDLTCLFCGARPGNSGLNVAHIVPYSKGGSDHDNNLVTACIGCNATAGARVAVPEKYRTGEVDSQGWIIWKRWGNWVIHYLDDPPEDPNEGWPYVDSSADIAFTFQPLDYWILLPRVHEDDWESHLRQKSWMTTARDKGRDSDWVDPFYSPENWPNFLKGIAFARTLVRKDYKRPTRYSR